MNGPAKPAPTSMVDKNAELAALSRMERTSANKPINGLPRFLGGGDDGAVVAGVFGVGVIPGSGLGVDIEVEEVEVEDWERGVRGGSALTTLMMAIQP